MKLCLGVISLLLFAAGTLTQDFNLADALDDFEPTPAKPKAPAKPKNEDPDPKADKPGVKPPKSGGGDLNLLDAFGVDPTLKPEKPTVKPPKSGGGGFDLEDALGPDLKPKPDKPAVNPPSSGGGGGSFDDSDLADVAGGDYKPDGGRAASNDNDPQGGSDEPQEANAGPIAAIVSSIGVALFGAVSSYIAYQKKRLCFKIQGGMDPEQGKEHPGQSDPQVYSNLLKTS